MKNIFTAAFILISFATFSQQDSTSIPEQTRIEVPDRRDTGKNELSIGAFNLVAFGALDLGYERILTPNTSIAVEGFILALNRESEDIAEAYSKDFSVTGKFKYFFGDYIADGYYVNGLVMVSTGEFDDNEDERYDPVTGFSTSEVKEYTDLALGFGLGWKLVARQGFFVDLNGGIGRNLLSNNSPTIVGQFNINLGMRF